MMNWVTASYDETHSDNRMYIGELRWEYTKGNYNVFSANGDEHALVVVFSDQKELLEEVLRSGIVAYRLQSLDKPYSRYENLDPNGVKYMRVVSRACALTLSGSTGEFKSLSLPDGGHLFCIDL